jgi:ABC-type polysaccharide/polyol phosphate transport system ATPase subunit
MSPGLPSEPDSVDHVAIAVNGVTKTFRLPHERRTTLKEYFQHPLRRTQYEVQRALQDVTFSIARGEFFGIIGPNGGGKSTLLKIIASIYRQDGGTVQVNGLLSPFIELGVGFHPELTARDNVRINSTLLGLTRRELNKRYDAIVSFSELERFMDQRLKNFSSGMQVRLAYAIAIQVDFDILLLDEVLAVGDESFQQKCLGTFDRFRDEGKTIVLVTHALGLIERFADRALLLDDGRVGALGPPGDVIDRYRGRLAVDPSGAVPAIEAVS